jgi:hypothetical protein
MKNFRWLAFAILAVLLISSAAVDAFADDDPPSRVARLKYVTGEVSIQPGGVDEWVGASINRPLTTADRVWTDQQARAELHLGTAAMRMNSETSLEITNLNDDTVQVALYQGTLNLRISRLLRGETYEIDTPNIAFTVLKAGSYRFDVDANDDTTFVTVWKGQGIATGDLDGVRVRARQRARFQGGKSFVHRIYAAPRFDGFDQWCQVRDQREFRVLSARYVSPYVIGYEDLDHHGRWRVVAGYGSVWFPRVIAGWAPYRYGRWIWVAPWGWTWVDDASWGFAPFHYGRWVYVRGAWGWVPGPVTVRAYYAPALVVWVGGPRWGVRLGWFPLSYREPYIPWYRTSRNYFQNVNISNTHITNITHVTNTYYTNVHNNVHINVHQNIHNNIHIKYANRHVPDGVTVVDRDAVVKSHHVAKAKVKIHVKDLDDTAVHTGPVVTPEKSSVLGNHGRGPAVTPPGPAVSRRVVAKLPPPAKPTRFEARQKEYEQETRQERRDEKADRAFDRQEQDTRGRSTKDDSADRSTKDMRVDSQVDRRVERPADRRDEVRGTEVRGNAVRGNDEQRRGPFIPRPPHRRANDEQPTSTGDMGRPHEKPMRDRETDIRDRGQHSPARPAEEDRKVQQQQPGPRDAERQADAEEGRRNQQQKIVPRPPRFERVTQDESPRQDRTEHSAQPDQQARPGSFTTRPQHSEPKGRDERNSGSSDGPSGQPPVEHRPGPNRQPEYSAPRHSEPPRQAQPEYSEPKPHHSEPKPRHEAPPPPPREEHRPAPQPESRPQPEHRPAPQPEYRAPEPRHENRGPARHADLPKESGRGADAQPAPSQEEQKQAKPPKEKNRGEN